MTDTPPDFSNNYEGYMAWAKDNPSPFSPYFCDKHWAPCPVEGKPGVLVSVIMFGEAFAFLPTFLKDPQEINGWLMEMTEPICCKLGDEKMTWLWEFVDAPHCGAAEGKPKGRRVCWFPPNHIGKHEWETEPKSIFTLMEK